MQEEELRRFEENALQNLRQSLMDLNKSGHPEVVSMFIPLVELIERRIAKKYKEV